MSGRRLDLTPLVLVAMILVMDMSMGVSAFPNIQDGELEGQNSSEIVDYKLKKGPKIGRLL